MANRPTAEAGLTRAGALRVGALLLVVLAAGVASLVARPKASGLGLPLTEARSTLFAGSGNCAQCHNTNGEVLISSTGEDLSIPESWRGTMMANSFHDPYFQATLAKETKLRPHLKAEIEDECLKCHAPLGHTEAHFHGATHYSLEEAHADALAREGVSCTLCHQIQPDNLGTPESYSGHYIIRNTRQIFGPYQDVYTFAMEAGLNYTPQFGAHKMTSEVCATCHTLFTPIRNDADEVVGQFPEQTTYLEWKNSVFAQAESLKTCQECHMPRIDEGILISHDPPVEPRSPFWKHYFVGGNVFMLRILRDNIDALGLTADESHFNTSIGRTLTMLQEHSVRLDARAFPLSGGRVRAEVRAENLTGHKLPSGYPARRFWLHVVARDAAGNVLFESGAHDAEGHLLAPTPAEGFHPHHRVIRSPDEVQVYEAVFGDARGRVVTSLLSPSQYLKDNRLVPRGYVLAGPDVEHTRPDALALADPDFNRDGATEGTGADVIAYEFPVGSVPAGEVVLTVRALYQSISKPFLDAIAASNTTPGEQFLAMVGRADKAPTVMAEVQLSPGTASGDAWLFH